MSLTVRGPGTSSAALRTSDDAYARGISRISSGFRINRAADDAAGLAISQRMRSQVTGSAMAMRNVQDGINMLQTAEAGLSGMTSMLQRARELAVQAASTATMTAGDRKAAAAEVRQLVSEIDRTARTTSFNGLRMLDGSRPGRFVFQVGAKAGDVLGVAAYDLTAGALQLSGAVASVSTLSTSVTTYAAESAPLTSYTSSAGQREFSFSVDGGPLRSIKIKKDQTYTAANIGDLRKALQDGLNAQVPPIPVTVSVVDHGSGPLLRFEVTGSPTTSLSVTGSGATAMGGVTTSSTTATTVSTVTTAASAALADLIALGSGAAISLCDDALTRVTGARTQIGAMQNRMEHQLSALATTGENLDAARSRIEDADVAKEWAGVVRAQVLSQAGMAMQAQGAQSGQRVLQLLTSL